MSLAFPETGGKIICTLDQVRAITQEMRDRNYQRGFEIEPKIIVVTSLIPEAGDTT